MQALEDNLEAPTLLFETFIAVRFSELHHSDGMSSPSRPLSYVTALYQKLHQGPLDVTLCQKLWLKLSHNARFPSDPYIPTDP